jgi:hypothetical protein
MPAIRAEARRRYTKGATDGIFLASSLWTHESIFLCLKKIIKARTHNRTNKILLIVGKESDKTDIVPILPLRPATHEMTKKDIVYTIAKRVLSVKALALRGEPNQSLSLSRPFSK